jgi:L,D-peptidoglycan transpeptidase YkuD (ErfK/YbiS/YcfS/YnhG family)
VLAPATGVPAASAEVRVAESIRLGGVPVRLRPGTRQVVTVDARAGHRATIILWRRGKDEGDRWRRVLRTADGRTGYGGLVRADRRVQGSGATPLGTFTLPSTFGTHPRRTGWSLPYRHLRRGDYWVLDNSSPHYNRFRTKAQGGFRWWLPASHPDASEHLVDYPRQYEYAVATGFNADQVRHRGGAIFLHVNGAGPTAGCVSAPRSFLRGALARLDERMVPVIAIGR